MKRDGAEQGAAGFEVHRVHESRIAYHLQDLRGRLPVQMMPFAM
jgi:hypothetical protein